VSESTTERACPGQAAAAKSGTTPRSGTRRHVSRSCCVARKISSLSEMVRAGLQAGVLVCRSAEMFATAGGTRVRTAGGHSRRPSTRNGLTQLRETPCGLAGRRESRHGRECGAHCGSPQAPPDSLTMRTEMLRQSVTTPRRAQSIAEGHVHDPMKNLARRLGARGQARAGWV
jgi:hypothetical protein